MTRADAIRKRCKECAGTSAGVGRCEFTDCALWRYRGWGEVRDAPGDRVPRGRAIRLSCLGCCNEQSVEVGLCPAKLCPLWPYRRGHGEEMP